MLQQILGIFIPENVTKFACPQTLKVTCTSAWKNYIGEGQIFSYQQANIIIFNPLL